MDRWSSSFSKAIASSVLLSVALCVSASVSAMELDEFLAKCPDYMFTAKKYGRPDMLQVPESSATHRLRQIERRNMPRPIPEQLVFMIFKAGDWRLFRLAYIPLDPRRRESLVITKHYIMSGFTIWIPPTGKVTEANRENYLKAQRSENEVWKKYKRTNVLTYFLFNQSGKWMNSVTTFFDDHILQTYHGNDMKATRSAIRAGRDGTIRDAEDSYGDYQTILREAMKELGEEAKAAKRQEELEQNPFQ